MLANANDKGEGELCFRGRNRFAGYLKNPEGGLMGSVPLLIVHNRWVSLPLCLFPISPVGFRIWNCVKCLYAQLLFRNCIFISTYHIKNSLPYLDRALLKTLTIFGNCWFKALTRFRNCEGDRRRRLASYRRPRMDGRWKESLYHWQNQGKRVFTPPLVIIWWWGGSNVADFCYLCSFCFIFFDWEC